MRGNLTISHAVTYQWEGSEHSKLVPIVHFKDVTEDQARELVRDFKGENAPHNKHLHGVWVPFKLFL